MVSRRDAIGLLGGSALAALSGCCNLRSMASPSITASAPVDPPRWLKPTISKANAAPALCIDVHSHFFNASDVPVKGFVEGPVAHHFGGSLGELISALAPLAEDISKLAPTASDEYQQLLTMSGASEQPDVLRSENSLQQRVDAYHSDQSSRFYEVAKGSEFEKRYNNLQKIHTQRIRAQVTTFGSLPALGPSSLATAIKKNNRPISAVRASALTLADKPGDYPDGTLAFIGYMLSYRWMNIFEYSQAYSVTEGAFGIDHTLGAMVDFDRWYDCPPRSAHADQIKVMALLSTLSDGYMRPLVAYNPWADLADRTGQYHQLVFDTAQRPEFVGIKIYPPNGFRPIGNIANPIAVTHGPKPAALDRVLSKFWHECEERGIVVMSHTGESWGANDQANDASDPSGWAAMLADSVGHAPPKVNLGHFGGDESSNDWTQRFSAQMKGATGPYIYGDIAYWSNLRCETTGAATCSNAVSRLKSVLTLTDAMVPQRIMYGSDWLMLAQEPNWAMYPYDIAAATTGIIDQANLFGNNAKKCFSPHLG